MLFLIEYKKIALILTLLLLSSCKAAKPELTSLLGNPGGSSPAGSTNTGAGQFSLGGSVTKTIGTSYKINAHVSQGPTQINKDVAGFKVRARVKF